MEGYSVTEAASILGVPTERVWELLARGVLSGAAEGETGMRVFLQPRPAPAPPDPGRPNGSGAGREPERELSPFRELLTEFRNLTERYGQALLALGEARGEVATLRSRVDLLEARMDLRLPMSAPTSWPAPMPPAASTAAAAEEQSDVAPGDEVDPIQDADTGQDSDEDRPSRRRRQRRATENFAEALARAEDPTRPELPGAAETAAALAALRADGPADARASEGSLPRELPAADPIPLAEEAEPERPSRIVEDVARAPVTEASAPTAIAETPEPESAAAGPPEPEVERETATHDAPPIAWDPERYSVDIEEPDWYVEDEPLASAGVDAQPVPEDDPERSADDAGDSVSKPSVGPVTEPEASTRIEETVLWLGDAAESRAASNAAATGAETGADEMEVVGSQAPPDGANDATPTPAQRVLPGSRELDEALAALDALAGRTRSVDPVPRTWPVADPVPGRPVSDKQPRATTPGAVGGAPRLAAATPASRAYRRLRRIFPG